jgi:2-keto-3-deoxy-L-rhamnonate aldolase RhmA
MKDNLVKRALGSGGVAMGVMCLEFATTGIGPLSAAAGAEFAVFDMEHTGWGLETIKMLAATSAAAELVPIVRVPTTDYHFISHALDIGAMGLVIPMVADAQQARRAVEYASYPPRGRRGSAYAMAHDGYKARDVYKSGELAAQMAHADDNLLLIAQIETAEGLANVDAIAAVDGVDALWIGQYDLTASLGIPGHFEHPLFVDGSRKVVEACHRHNKSATLAVMSPDQLATGPANGYRMLVYAADSWIYQQALRRCFSKIREALGTRSH